jgi:hypothetical protein
MDGLWTTTIASSTWKWLHQDFAVQEWYVRWGHRLRFSCVFDYEYDLLIAGPLAALLPQPAPNQVAVSGIKKLSEVRSTWYWTSAKPVASGFERYQGFMRRRYGLDPQTYVTQGPFPVLPRAYLDAFATVRYADDVFGGVNCETSYPGVAEALGFTLIDTGLHPGWIAGVPTRSVSHLFHCEREPMVDAEQVIAELQDAQGRRAFHPVKAPIPHRAVLAALDAAEASS